MGAGRKAARSINEYLNRVNRAIKEAAKVAVN